ncbi:MAG TPA: S46 family peptidase [Caldithrix abyssi]|uniref:Dipeptidyl-peptidase n=1 Tax=Caldithrix abyssi TaxID=187145 RepID=A0A7V5UFG9_CALAY|nr:S46 family peptidase [Caldithrix abyssi]
MRRVFFFFLLLILFRPGHSEEGMFPLSDLKTIDFQKVGFALSEGDVFSPQHASLSDAIVKIGGCTGSFISAEGLILTNHHCAFGAVQRASTPQNDYLTNGFSARDRAHEIPAKGYTVRITESYRDVSAQILNAVKNAKTFREREQLKKKKMKEIVLQAEREHPGKRAEVAEMFLGQTYFLFIYTYLKDVRLVYVPPRAVGEFGGDIDNWEWPRHNADFSLLRAYVAPDGSPAAYAPENVPYRPKTHLKVNPGGANEEDFVFILGYPGRTYRHRTSHFIAYQLQVRMPFVVDWYQFQMRTMEQAGKNDLAVALKLSSAIKGLANTEKNYRGKIQGLKRIHLLEKKREQEAQIQAFINSDPQRKRKYGRLLARFADLYRDMNASARRELLLTYLRRSVGLFRIADVLFKAAAERQKPDVDRDWAFMDRNFKRTQKSVFRALKNFVPSVDRIVLKELLTKAQRLPSDQKIEALEQLFGLNAGAERAQQIITDAYRSTRLTDSAFVARAFSMSPQQLRQTGDPILAWREKLDGVYRKLKNQQEERSGALSELLAGWSEVKRDFLKKRFIPDANGTFRLSYGHVRGYSPADAVYMEPFTTARGILEKTTGQPPFNTPPDLLQLLKTAAQRGRFLNRKLKTVSVCLLYDTDTTGGNSGSPVLNARGQLVGLNFDRTFQATINDFAWNEAYSRSIGVDIRYILWLLHHYAGADHLLQEIDFAE